MSVLTGPEIVRIVKKTKMVQQGFIANHDRTIHIEPFDPERAGPNSYDVTLSPNLLVYDEMLHPLLGAGPHLDMKYCHRTREITIPEDGLILEPGQLYLGATNEKMWCKGLTPWLDGRSSVGRLGMTIHVTAGRGDCGWGFPDGASWTLEISVVQRLRVYPNVRIGQVTFFTMEGDQMDYAGKYNVQDGPVPSRLWKDFLPKEQTGG